MANNRILFVVTSHDQLGDTGKPTGYHLAEVTHPYHILTEAGYDVDFASPKGGEPPMDPGSDDRDDPHNVAFLEGEGKQKLDNSLKLSDVHADAYAAVYFPGGHGAMWDLPDDVDAQRITAKVYESGGVVGAVCHGPAALVNVEMRNGDPLVKGKRINSFTNDEEVKVKLDDTVPFLLQSKLEERGAEHVPGKDFERQLIIDGRLVTGQNPASVDAVANGIVDLLKVA